jgi:autotransporter-associated beta strand protein
LNNWQGGAVPAVGADLIFTGSSQTNVATAGTRTTGAITFDSAASAFTIGGDAITLGGNIANNSTATQTINSAIALNADRTIAANTGNLVLGGNIALSNNGALPGTLTFSGNSSTSVSGVISDGPAAGGSLMKTGNGTLTLTGNNSFTGTLTIAGGTVEANSSEALGNGLTVTTNTLVFDNGTLRAIGNINAGAPVTRAVQLLGNGTLDTNGNQITIGGPIVGAGNLIKTGAGNLTLTQGGATNNSYSGATIVQQGSLFVGYAGALGAATGGTTVQSGGSLVIANQFNVIGESLTMNGTGDGGNGALRLAAGFQSSWNGTITLTGNSSIQADPNSTLTLQQVGIGGNNLAFTGANSTINLSGSLSGSGGLVMNNTGKLNISGTNTGFTGSTSVQSGTLSVQNGLALGNGTSSLNVASGGSILLESQDNLAITFSSITLNGTGAGGLGAIFNASKSATVAGDITLGGNALVNSVSGNLTLAGNIATAGNSLTVSNTGSLATFSGGISGSGSLTVNGTAPLVLSGNNSFSGGTTINNGASLAVASNTALGSGNTTVVSGGTLQFQGGVSVAAGNLTVSGAGVNSGGALQNISGNNTCGGGITLTSNPYLTSKNGTLTLSGSISSSSNTIIHGPGTVYFSGDASGYTSGQVQVFSGTFASGNMTGATVNVAAQAPAPGETPAYSPNNLGSGGNTTVAGLITNAGARLLLDLGNTASQTDQISSGSFGIDPSTLFVFYNNGFTASGNYTILNKTSAGNVNWGSANLKFQAEFSGLSGSFSGDNTQQLIFNAVAGPAVWDNGAATGLWGTAGNWQTGNSPGGGSAVAFTSANATTVDTQTDRLAGDITFQSGSAALVLGNNTITTYGRIRNESAVTQTISSGLALSGNASIDAAAGNLAITGPVSFGTGTTRTLTFTGGNNTTVSGVISGGNATAGALVKTGSGRLTLTGNNTFTGTTTISTGTLVINGSMAAGNDVSVSAGGTLAGSGTVAGQVSVAGTLSPGNSPGTISTGSEVWVDGGNYNWQIFNATEAPGTGYDTTSITGGLDLTSLTSGGFSINLWSLSAVGPDSNGNALNFVDASNYTWTLVSTTTGITGFSAGDFAIHDLANNGTAGFSNSFAGTFSVSVSGNNLLLNYTAVPESATWVLVAGSTFGLGLLRRRIRRTPPRDVPL